MQLEPYISDLLYRYECVTVPGFGSFLTRRTSATIHDTTHAFYPPKKVVFFNQQIQENDGLLARYIADVEKIPYEDALQVIEKRVAYLKSYLVAGDAIVFENIGSLSLNKESNMVFEPSYSFNYLTDAFGLGQFTAPEIAREVAKPAATITKPETPVVPIAEKKRQSRGYLKYAAVGLIAITVGGLVASNHYSKQIEAHNQLAQETANAQLEAKIQEATFVINSPLPAVTLNVKKQYGNYHIVAGAFRLEANSDKKVNELKNLGFEARKIGTNKYGLHEVVYASYQTREEATRSLLDIKKTHNKEAWLLVKTIKE
ncbi:SPOR domain-containing protein [Bizionia sediminis]|uniref:SPOR domain-containing protein n=2 Tax=Bizionia sediminis TaxID=1737064 RepID=A0ABW5KRY9_9FLAO